jgi:streptogramin lyase
VPVIVSFNNTIFSGVNGSGIHTYSDGVWTLESYLQGDTFSFLSASANLTITSSSGISSINSVNGFATITDPLILNPHIAMEDGGTFWIGETGNGLVGNPNTGFEKFLGNGPSNKNTWRLQYDGTSIHALAGGYSSGFLPLNRVGWKDLFTKGLWTNTTNTIFDLTDISFNGTFMYTSSFGYGVLQQDESSMLLYDETNSPLENISPGRNVYVTAMESSPDGVWIANYRATNTYHLLKSDNTWQSFSFSQGVSRYPTAITIDVNGSIWAPQSQLNGGGIFVFNATDNEQVYLTETPSSGGLPNRNVNAVAMDRDGAVWVGMEKGVAYFANPYAIFSSSVNAIRPIFENRFLLQDEKITAIEVDGGNRKWIGTERGVWLFNPTGESMVYNFTSENSPLLSNKIVDIEIDKITGEVFFATDKGIVSFRSDATNGNPTFDAVKIFPNPVTPDFSGNVGISGLTTDAIVKITDVSGKLVFETRAEGGTAVWGVRDYSGNRVSTGVYLVFASTADGSSRVVGKLAVIK